MTSSAQRGRVAVFVDECVHRGLGERTMAALRQGCRWRIMARRPPAFVDSIVISVATFRLGVTDDLTYACTTRGEARWRGVTRAPFNSPDEFISVDDGS